MEDSSVAVSVPLDALLERDEVNRPQPLRFSERTKNVLPDKSNILQMCINDVEEFAKSNNMQINYSKTKVMKFSRSSSIDFPLEVPFSNKVILEVIRSTKLLGVIIDENLKWESNTEYICDRARGKIWLLRPMKISGLTQAQLIDAYTKEVRSILELAVPVWNAGITLEQTLKLERIQKSALSAILGHEYVSYENALQVTGLQRLSTRREKICIQFVMKNMKSDNPLFKVNPKIYNTRSNPNFVEEFQCRTAAFFNSSLPYLARLYNKNINC